MTLWEEAGLPPLSIRAQLRFDVVSRVVDDLGPRTVLEVGCGQGAVGARLSTWATYVGVEPDSRSCEVARLRIEPRGGTVIQGTDRDVETGRTFDLVCAFEVLEHIEDDVAALQDWAVRVRPGGDLLLSVPADQKRFGPMDEQVGHFRRYDEHELSAVVRAAGLVVARTVRYGWPLTHVLEGVRNGLDRRRGAAAREHSPEALSAASGRTFQPSGAVSGRAVELATLPFRYVQRLRPQAGTGLVLVATKT